MRGSGVAFSLGWALSYLMNDPRSLPPDARKKFYQGKANALRRRAEAEPFGAFKDRLLKSAGEYDLLAVSVLALSSKPSDKGR